MSEDREKAEKWASSIHYSNSYPLEDYDLVEAHLAGQESMQEEINALKAEVAALREAVRDIRNAILGVRTGAPREELWKLLKFAAAWDSHHDAIRRALEEKP